MKARNQYAVFHFHRLGEYNALFMELMAGVKSEQQAEEMTAMLNRVTLNDVKVTFTLHQQ